MAFMNYLVFLDTRAGELEKILSGIKTMLVKEFDPAQSTVHPINPGDSLYFLRGNDDCAVRVKAIVASIRLVTNKEDLSQTLKAIQLRLQLTEEQYNHWSEEPRGLLVEFGSAQKIGVIKIAPEKTAGRPDWIAFEDFNQISE
jgi:hypothetical protein